MNAQTKEITLAVSELKQALPGLTKIIGKSRTLPVLQTVRINRNQEGIVTLYATDLDSFLSYTAKEPQQAKSSRSSMRSTGHRSWSFPFPFPKEAYGGNGKRSSSFNWLLSRLFELGLNNRQP